MNLFCISNGNVVDDLLLLNGGARHDNDTEAAKDDTATAAAFPTHHTIIVPAPMDVRRDRNSRDEFGSLSLAVLIFKDTYRAALKGPSQVV